jgi:S1-C subfamily serine protease
LAIIVINRTHTRKRLVAYFSLLLTYIVLLLLSNSVVKAQIQSVSNNTGSILSSYSESSIPDLFDKVKSSIVQITPSSKSMNSSLLGSGFVYDKFGHILTNSHVVENASSVTVTFIDGNRYDAIIKGNDPISDIAILELSENITDTESIIPVQFGNSSAIRIGERVLAVGNPYGFSNTLTGGFVSQVGRLILESESIGPYPHANMIQTDAVINPGNSGGPLFNLKGEVIGMNTAQIDSPDGGLTGLGFAIPSKTILREVPILIENGTYKHPWLGMSALNLNPDLNEEFGLPPNFKGVLIDSLVANGPTDKAGIQGRDLDPLGDIIIGLDGLPIKNINELLSYIENNKVVGDMINITVHRNNQTIDDIVAVLEERPILQRSSPHISLQTPLF